MTNWRASDLDVVFAAQGEMNATANLRALSDACWRAPIIITNAVNPVWEAAKLSTTDRFLFVNGYHHTDIHEVRDVVLDDRDKANVTFAFDARNAVNDLTHEIGITCWSRDHVLAGGHDQVQFERLGRLSGVDRFNVNAESAFIRGYQNAAQLSTEARPSADEFAAMWLAMSAPRRSWLLIWLSIGADRPFGVWTIIGARRAMVDLWVQKTTNTGDTTDAAYVLSRFQRVSEMNPDACASRLGHILNPLGLELPALSESQSRFFRAAYIQQDAR